MLTAGRPSSSSVDNTLLDNDRIQADLRRHLEREFGAACCDRYWTILEQLFAELERNPIILYRAHNHRI